MFPKLSILCLYLRIFDISDEISNLNPQRWFGNGKTFPVLVWRHLYFHGTWWRLKQLNHIPISYQLRKTCFIVVIGMNKKDILKIISVFSETILFLLMLNNRVIGNIYLVYFLNFNITYLHLIFCLNARYEG